MTDHAYALIQSSITAAAGLLGVLIGGLITARNQGIERRNNRRREQLMEFYSPLRGMRAEIRAKSVLGRKLSAAAGKLWQDQFAGTTDPEIKRRIEEQNSPRYERFLEYTIEQLREELIPRYRRMLDHFTAHMGLAEPSTLDHYQELVEFVEVWNRWLKDSVPTEVVDMIHHTESKLNPLYEDIERHFAELSSSLKK